MKNRLRSEQTSTRIKKAAVQLFAQQGYSAAGVAEICAAAEVSKGAFYHHFKSKNELFLFLLEDWLDLLDERLHAIVSDPAPFTRKLERMGEIVVDLSADHQRQIPILFEFWMQAARDETVWKAAIAPFQRYQRFFARLIQSGIDEGYLAPLDPQAGAHALVSLAIGLLLERMLFWRYGSRGADDGERNGTEELRQWATSVQQGIQIFIRGMKRDI